MANIVVAGAGIVGVSCAIWAQRAGHQVTIVDRGGAAQDKTSYGNAGLLAAAAVVPVTVPGVAKKGFKMLFDRDQPLFLRWRYLPKLLPFLRQYLSFATQDHVDFYALNMAYLMSDTVEQHIALATGTGAESFIVRDNYCFGYDTHAAYQADIAGWNLRRAHGVDFEVLTGAEYAAIDPMYPSQFETVILCKNHGRISDPGAYLAALLQYFQDQGGTYFEAMIDDIEVVDGACVALDTDLGRIAADNIILALGPWSAKIAKKMGVEKLSFEAERGYHIELHNPSNMPISPMMNAKGKFVATPMEGRLRFAGVVEFGGLGDEKSRAPLDFLKRQVAALFPDLKYERMTEWMGRRPSTSDSLPIIGPSAKKGGYLAFGHQHLGLTAGPKTGRIIADMISDVPANTDLSAFGADRYS